MRALLAGLLAAALGTTSQLVTFDVYDTDGGAYYVVKTEGWLSDAGVLSYPPLAPNLVPLNFLSQAVCASVTLCVAYDGGAQPFQVNPFACACSSGASCNYVATGGYDGGVAPTAVTLPKGSFTGAGCVPKSCTALFQQVALADGGVDFDSSWLSQCPR